MDFEKAINEINEKITALQNNVGDFPDHIHNGTDFSFVRFENISRKKIWVHHTIPGANAATAANYGIYWIAPMKCLVNGFYEVHQTKGTDGSAVTLQIEKLTGTTAAGSGNSLLGTALSLKATDNTVQTGTLVVTTGYTTLAIGDRLAMKLSGTPTSLSTVSILTELIII